MKNVRDYYTTQVQMEWRRLLKNPYRRLEYDTTWYFLEKYLPPRGRVLDAGGGPGRYTLELARRGFQVVLLDLTPANLEFARRQVARARLQGRVDVVEGTITDLSSFEDDSFDAVVCTGGPLSHVLNREKREKAITELVRVDRTGAPLFASVIGRMAMLVIELVQFPHELQMPLFKKIRDTGDYEGRRGFTACHFFLPEELEDAFQSRGVEVLEMAGLEGIEAMHERKVNAAARDSQRWRIWLETHYRTCTHPSAVGISEHMLLVGRKA